MNGFFEPIHCPFCGDALRTVGTETSPGAWTGLASSQGHPDMLSGMLHGVWNHGRVTVHLSLLHSVV